jgi:electron transfer flavoprotein beta subunit
VPHHGPVSRSKARTLADRSAGEKRVILALVKVAVCVKEVPDASAPKRLDPQTRRLDRSVEGALNPFDTHAVEEALRLKEAGGDGEVVVVSMGPERAANSLRRALEMGADRVVLVSDDAAAGSDLVATSRIVAAALERERPDLVLFGQQASDSDGAVLWAAVADRLGLPLISQAATLEVADGKARSKRQTEYGYDVIEAPLPCIVAVSDAINEPRYPSLKGIMGAKGKPQETISLGDLGVSGEEAGESGSGTEVYAVSEPPPRGDTLKIEDEGDAAEKISEFLVQRKLI